MRNLMIYISIFFILSTLSYMLLSYEKDEKINEYLLAKTEHYKKHYQVLYDEHKTLSHFIFQTRINTSKVIEIFKDAGNTTREHHSELREELYFYLKDTYALLKEYKIKQLHFHLANNDSFLRFHRPKKFGDNLTNIRETVKYVNETKKPIDGFEEGRIYNGYRFVFPMFDEARHIGSVEISFSTLAMNKEYMHDYNVTSNFLILKSVVNKKVFEDEKSNYIDSFFEKFYFEKAMLLEIGKIKHINLFEPPSQSIIDILNKKAEDLESFSVYDPLKKSIITFIKVQNPISKKVVGIFMVRSNSKYISNKMKNFYMLLIFVNLFIAVIMFFIYKERKYRDYIQQSNKKLQKSAQEILAFNQTLEDKVEQRTDEQNTLLSLFDTGDSVLFKWKNDESWSVEFASLGVNKLLGYSLEDLRANKISYASCIYKEDLEQVMSEITTARLSKESHFKHRPYRIITKDGDVKWVLDYTIIVRDEKENILHYIGHTTDITQLKSMQKQLFEKSRMAQMGEMISMIAHQWRQPLGAISTTSIDLNIKLELEIFDMKTQDGREEAMEYFKNSLSQIEFFVQSLTNTIDDFRSFYKPNKDKEVSLINLPIQKAFEILEASLSSNNIKILREYKSKEKLLMYPNELMQVILNILKNAQDNFLEKKISNAHIIIKTFDTLLSSVIEICDNGGGISQDIIDKIFDPYFSTKDEKNGTGLGLYMSKIIVEEHHDGIITMQNTKDGVCFNIELFKNQEGVSSENR